MWPIIAAGSAVVLVQTAIRYSSASEYTCALVISVMSLIVSTIWFIMPLAGCHQGRRYELVVALILFVLWTIDTVITTFSTPYAHLGNGYLGTVLCLATCLLLTVTPLQETLEMIIRTGSVLLPLLAVASTLVFAQTLDQCSSSGRDCGGEEYVVLVISCISAIVCALLHVPAVGRAAIQAGKVLSVIFLLAWMIAFYIGTFEGMYKQPANLSHGYFGSWAALMLSAIMVCFAFRKSLKIPPPIIALFMASVVVLLACIRPELSTQTFWDTWAFVAAAGGVLFSAAIIAMILVDSDGARRSFGCIIVFGWCWWLFGTGCMTFSDPFTVVSNGYFSAWVAFILTSVIASSRVGPVRNLMAVVSESDWVIPVLLIASATLLTQSVLDCTGAIAERRCKDQPESQFRNCDVEDVCGQQEYPLAMACSSISLLVLIVTLVCAGRVSASMRVVSVILVIIWSVACSVFTFYDPYTNAGNGYFACWLGFFSSIILALQSAGYGVAVEITTEKQVVFAKE